MCKKCVLSEKQIQTILGCHCGQNGPLLCFLMTNYYAMKRVMQPWQSWALMLELLEVCNLQKAMTAALELCKK